MTSRTPQLNASCSIISKLSRQRTKDSTQSDIGTGEPTADDRSFHCCHSQGLIQQRRRLRFNNINNKMKPQPNWLCSLLALASMTSSSIALAANHGGSFLKNIPHGGARVVPTGESTGVTSTGLHALTVDKSKAATDYASQVKAPLRVLFLSSDTGGGHRASAEALGKQFLLQHPGSSYELADLWTDHGVLPYRTIVNTYKHFSSHPRQWRLFYYLSNSRANEIFANQHTRLVCGKDIKKRIESFNPDVVVSVHPTMNYTPLLQTQNIGKELGKHIPFYTVVTDLGSGHSMWFSKNVDKLYVASERLRKIAKRRAKAPDEKIFMAGLPIRHDFAVQAENMGDRTTEVGKAYQRKMRELLGVNPNKQLVLVMGGGEGVGSLSSIVDELYTEFYKQGVDATICVVCGRNEKLKKTLESRDWDAVANAVKKPRKHRRLLNFFYHRVRRSRKIDDSIKKVEELEELPHGKGKVDVVGLGFVTNMAEYMAASDVLVTKAGPGTIAEAAAVGLPVFLTSFLPGQEAGNVDVVLESGYGDYNEDPASIAHEVGCWLQDSELMNSMSRLAQKAGNPYAADEIVQDIGTQTITWMELNSK